MDALLCELSLAVDGILDILVLHHLDTLAVHRLLQAVSGYHVQLANAILKEEKMGKITFPEFILIREIDDCTHLLHCYRHGDAVFSG